MPRLSLAWEDSCCCCCCCCCCVLAPHHLSTAQSVSHQVDAPSLCSDLVPLEHPSKAPSRLIRRLPVSPPDQFLHSVHGAARAPAMNQ
ncbi:unnamed protein product [Periconia digitata]|uniref:Uncharacterized protein n=1 Tax=Periconia digitata TaxID=1303443 RepID=A0A9W4UCL8_9PLEO|nr:unnamed protein product [Periconia digitata]